MNAISRSVVVAADRIPELIRSLRERRVILDADLARIYGVQTRALNQAVKRNLRRFPADFFFQLTSEEKNEVITNCDHLANLRFAKTLPLAFTEHGALKAAMVLNIRNVFAEGELAAAATLKEFLTVRQEGSRQVSRSVEHYNLDVIISVGYRVKSHRGTQFRIWATQRLREYIVKGFTLDDERLKQGGTKNEYFDELLQRIREIRLSERNFYRKICDIYRTSVDYDPSAEMTQLFFQTVQNKMHWAVHGQTAAEVIHRRAKAAQPPKGLTSWKAAKPRKPDVAIAKNYLTAEELKKLSLVVTQYLDFAELQALERRPMTMRDWIAKLDAFLRAGDREILEHAGSISVEEAKRKAELEFEKFERQRRLLEDAQGETEFVGAVESLAKKAKELKPPKRKK